MSLLNRPVSPQSRRSSSLSTLGFYGNIGLNNNNNNIHTMNNTNTTANNNISGANMISLYSHQFMKKKNTRWKIIRNPIPSNPVYRKTICLALLFSCLATILLISATLTSKWELINFKYDLLIKHSVKKNFNKNCTFNYDLFLNDQQINTNYTINLIVLHNGLIITQKNLDSSNELCSKLINNPNTILGLLINLKNSTTTTNNNISSTELINNNKLGNVSSKQILSSSSSSSTSSWTNIKQTTNSSSSSSIHSTSTSLHHGSLSTPSSVILSRFNNRNKYIFSPQDLIKLVENDFIPMGFNEDLHRNFWLIMNLNAGIWNMCYQLADNYREKLLHHALHFYPDSNDFNLDCISYLQSSITETRNACVQFLLKMQNNIISCFIVVYLSVIASVLIGLFSIIFRTVPGAMVTGVLYVTSGVFIIFANCIHHTKLNRLENEWGPCYPISQLPEILYNAKLITVHTLWPVIVSWISAFVYFIASITWMILTQLMTFENSKTMI